MMPGISAWPVVTHLEQTPNRLRPLCIFPTALRGWKSAMSDFLLTDLYELAMMQAYLEAGKTETAVFEFFVRKLPPERNFLMAAGLDQCLEFLEDLRADEAQLDWLRTSGQFGADFVDYLSTFRFTGAVHAMPEGTVFFPDEPILRVTAPMPEAQLVESRLINLLHFQTVIASKAARMVLAAPERKLVDFGLRRAHGAEAGVLAARASFLAGFDGSATVEAGERYGVPVFGTMAHSFIQAFDDEGAAFEAFARARPQSVTLLIDTYDTVAGAHRAVEVASRLKEEGIRLGGVRLDSGDLGALAKSVRKILDAGNFEDALIFASGGLDEIEIARLVGAGAPIDGFGVGTSLTTSSDAPALDCAYKLQEYAGLARRKTSLGKATWPGRKQVWRWHDENGIASHDLVSTEDEVSDGTPLIAPVMQSGRRLSPAPSLDEMRAHARDELDRLPVALRSLEPAPAYPVQIGPRLRALAKAVDARIASAS